MMHAVRFCIPHASTMRCQHRMLATQLLCKLTPQPPDATAFPRRNHTAGRCAVQTSHRHTARPIDYSSMRTHSFTQEAPRRARTTHATTQAQLQAMQKPPNTKLDDSQNYPTCCDALDGSRQVHVPRWQTHSRMRPKRSPSGSSCSGAQRPPRVKKRACQREITLRHPTSDNLTPSVRGPGPR